ncbi:hypothetical protein [uncultured Kordia sp.]|uniref:hypothetical protein n=1 Tax=uncultured Kordia sp. TaxID=507699 RepID=UPI00263934CC|nr:hypothetical protein [uncultured Kordia sp.]
MKKIIIIVLLALVSNTIYAQKVKFKKDKVKVDGKEIFKFEREDFGSKFTIYSLDGEDELIYMEADNGGTQNYFGDDAVKIVFFDSEKTLFTSSLAGKSWKNIIKILYKGKVFNDKGEIDEKKVRKFILKYQ